MKYPMGSFARHRLIESRSSTPAWKEKYLVCQRATRDEAPAISQPATIFSPKIGRDIHVMSEAEGRVILAALYSPNLVDINEQRPLSIFPSENPLAGHPETAGMTLMPVRGTAYVAEELDMYDRHPRIREGKTKLVGGKTVDNPHHEMSGKLTYYLSDALVILRDKDGVYAVNWNIKPEMEAFFNRKYYSSMRRIRQANNKMNEDDSRHRLEEVYYLDAEIRTERIAASSMDGMVSANLELLVCYAAQKEPLQYQEKLAMIKLYSEAFENRTTVLSMFDALSKKFGCKRQACLTVFYQAIWHRLLRVDLFQPILVDKPLVRESRDVLDVYAAWFRR